MTVSASEESRIVLDVAAGERGTIEIINRNEYAGFVEDLKEDEDRALLLYRRLDSSH